jgi:hypothetical protein
MPYAAGGAAADRGAEEGDENRDQRHPKDDRLHDRCSLARVTRGSRGGGWLRNPSIPGPSRMNSLLKDHS